ncbi:amidohydrolase family protein [Bacillus carboniphilus]|uniref:Amidohydrolase family protein n=1 Tax=Bacillus carboniphilus TaxID=86663 RepID=A0ABY9JZL6_9BACI|nr:amidohydrolase family protein [Bacillus carboniphilus]WLR43040.1 amidohydrolase family protein [Bacillus carboniphilus]
MAKGLDNDVYELANQRVFVQDGKATLEDGTLAGSMLTMNSAVLNMMSFTNCSIEDCIKMSSVNPAKQLGIWKRKGSIDIGKDADIVVLNENNFVVMTICKGTIAFSHHCEPFLRK